MSFEESLYLSVCLFAFMVSKQGAYPILREEYVACPLYGDDYIVKPFSPRELLMKVEALIRRYTTYGAKEEGETLRLYGGVVLNADRREVIKNGNPVDTRDKELEVLIYLAKNRGRAVSASELYESVWGEMALPSSGNTVTVHILNLRRKLEDNPSNPKLIRTVWGKGYQID